MTAPIYLEPHTYQHPPILHVGAESFPIDDLTASTWAVVLGDYAHHVIKAGKTPNGLQYTHHSPNGPPSTRHA